jgi:hypothetical protein
MLCLPLRPNLSENPTSAFADLSRLSHLIEALKNQTLHWLANLEIANNLL